MNEPDESAEAKARREAMECFRSLHIGDCIVVDEDGQEFIANLDGVLIPRDEWYAQFACFRQGPIQRPDGEPKPDQST